MEKSLDFFCKPTVIATHKGGTGKTVTAMALSAALARAGKTCLLIDLDPQEHSTLGLGVDLDDGTPTIREFFHEPSVPLRQLIRETHIPGCHIIPANIRLARIAQALYMRPRREELLKRGLTPLVSHYQFIVLPGFSDPAD